MSRELANILAGALKPQKSEGEREAARILRAVKGSKIYPADWKRVAPYARKKGMPLIHANSQEGGYQQTRCGRNLRGIQWLILATEEEQVTCPRCSKRR